MPRRLLIALTALSALLVNPAASHAVEPRASTLYLTLDFPRWGGWGECSYPSSSDCVHVTGMAVTGTAVEAVEGWLSYSDDLFFCPLLWAAAGILSVGASSIYLTANAFLTGVSLGGNGVGFGAWALSEPLPGSDGVNPYCYDYRVWGDHPWQATVVAPYVIP